MIWFNQILQGLLLGGYYALIACGLSFMFSVMRIINLAHGSLAVLAAFMLFTLAKSFGIHPFLGLLIVLPAMALIGWTLQRTVLERSARGGQLVPVLSTFGLAIVIDNLLFQTYGADTRSLTPMSARCPTQVGACRAGSLSASWRSSPLPLPSSFWAACSSCSAAPRLARRSAPPPRIPTPWV